jgi:hypothetical protein
MAARLKVTEADRAMPGKVSGAQSGAASRSSGSATPGCSSVSLCPFHESPESGQTLGGAECGEAARARICEAESRMAEYST